MKIKAKLFVKIAAIMILSLMVTNLLTVATASLIMQNTFIHSVTLSNNKILEQISLRFKELNTQIISITNAYRQNAALKQYFTNTIGEDDQELFSLFYNIKMQLKNVEMTSGVSQLNIATLGKNGRTFVSSGDALRMTPEELKSHAITEESIANSNKLIYRYNSEGLLGNTKNKPIIVGAKQLIDPYASDSFGTIYITMDENDFSQIYSGFTTEGNDMMLIDPEGWIVSCNDKSILGTQDYELLARAQEIIDTQEPYEVYEDASGKNIVLAKYLPIYEMYLVNVVHMNVILENFVAMRPIVFLICFLVTLVAVILVFLITRRITRPLTRLVEHMKQTYNGKFSKFEHIDGSYEVQELQVVYDMMINEIDQYVRRSIKEEKQRRKAELEALQMQINPHFLYNTLATIKYLSWQGNIQAVTSTINALIALLQNTISKNNEMTTIAQEVENLKNYVTINQARYGEGIRVEYYVNEVCIACKVPKLILQPFLENAFFHAYQQKKEGMIRVFISKKNNNLYCEILDDGDGISDEDQKTLFDQRAYKEHFSGIGINNVNQRIKLIYGEEYGVKIKSLQGEGTTVVITMPFDAVLSE